MNKTVYAVILCSALATGSSYSMDGDENSGGGIEATVAALRAEIQELREANKNSNDKWIALNGLIATFGIMTDPAIKQVEHLTEWATSQEQQVEELKDWLRVSMSDIINSFHPSRGFLQQLDPKPLFHLAEQIKLLK